MSTTTTTDTVRSADGTTIAVTRQGDGPPVVLVDGALCHRANGPSQPLAAALADRFTVHTYDRRGRGESGDTAPYAAEREVEDLQAVVQAAGGTACVYGISSGAVLALEAAHRGVPMTRLVAYEAPFVVDGSRTPVPADLRTRLDTFVAAGRRGDAVRLFLTEGVGLPRAVVALMRLLPVWKKLQAVAHTLPYDMALIGDGQGGVALPADRFAGVAVPTLALVGGKSPAWMHGGMQEVARLVPHAELRVLPGQNHMVKPAALAPVLVGYFDR